MTKEVRNILKVYHMATPEETARGLEWYTFANLHASMMSERHNLPMRIVVGVMAALSPNNKWTQNLKGAEAMLSCFLSGGSVVDCRPATYKRMRDKAWSILEAMPNDDAGVEAILRGQKITSFFRNIMGYDTCTVDGHALNITLGKRHGLKDNKEMAINKTRYLELQAAYQRAAKRVGLKVFELQAITWVVWKRIHNI